MTHQAPLSRQSFASEQHVEHLCELMHDVYEHAASQVGWETQERSRKPWSDVPEANKRAMRRSVLAMLVSLATDFAIGDYVPTSNAPPRSDGETS